MKDPWYQIVDAGGHRGRFTISTPDQTDIQIELESGERLTMPRAYAVRADDGSFRFAHRFASLLGVTRDDAVVFPVVAEVLEVGKRKVDRERVRLRTTVSTRDEVADLPLEQEDIEVTHVPIGRVVEAAAGPREDGDTLIVPVYEEVLYVEKRLLLREEVHVKRLRSETHAPKTVALRREEVSIERTPLDGSKRGQAEVGHEPASIR
ncbi:MAG: YsnF/AvaK domain-containing protein [Polyangiales bacterium]